MKSISFKNFRRFADFPEFNFGDITILVGGNNAGKSTLQKALLLVLDNIRSLRYKTNLQNYFEDDFKTPKFHFDVDDFHDLKLGTFNRVLFNHSTEQQIEFTLSVDNFSIKIVLEPDDAGVEQPIAKIALIEIKDIKRHIGYKFDFNTLRMRVEFEAITGNGDSRFDEIQKRIDELRITLQSEDDPLEAAMANQELEKLLKVRNAFVEDNNDSNEAAFAEADIQNYLGLKGERRVTSGLIPGYIENIEAYSWTIGSKTVDAIGLSDDDEETHDEPEEEIMNGTEEDYANGQILGDKASIIRESASAFQSEISFPSVYYIQAHGVTQKVAYTTNDKNDFMAEAIHKFVRQAIKPGSYLDSFLRKWMETFGIGTNYGIKSFGGEGYTIMVETPTGWMNLADLGMGSNQLMILLLSLVTIMSIEGHHGADGGKSFVPKYIILEEPEQNLHPCIQSKLADLFLDVVKDESYKFLVETHSEYLIRRTQVLVAEMNLTEEELEKQNPFKVYYFPHNGVPYDMKYLTSGRFDNKFGEGFFDEAAASALTISKIERKKGNV